MNEIKTAIGLMSGTSMDGIDAALLRSDGEAIIEVLAHDSFAYPPSFRTALKNGLAAAATIQQRRQRPDNLANLERQLTLYHAALVHDLLKRLRKMPDDIDLIGFHGQTVLHRPQAGLTVQLGDGALLAHETGIDVVYDMRANDITHGGQGAPLVPAYHAALVSKLGESLRFPVVFVNIGGIANLTYVSKSEIGADNVPIAFDCGPGNCLIDQWMEQRAGQLHDEAGRAGLSGTASAAILAAYFEHPYFHAEKPVSLDWRDFTPLTAPDLSLEDGAATLAHLTAVGIFRSLRFLPSRPASFIISGGGVKNRAIMTTLRDLATATGTHVMSAEECGLNADFIEAEAWGYLAIRARRDLPLTFPTTTGVSRPLSGGVFAASAKKGEARCPAF